MILLVRKFSWVFFFFCLTSSVLASPYLEMDLEALMDVTVTSLSKREEKLFDSAAALYVITAEDIRRSGATRIEEALRMVPGLMVAQNNAWIWSISSRGRSYNSTYENKLLVLVDGQSVYSPIFSGTLWDTLNLFMEDIDRVEIIRGPGGSTWGSNAVNGIVNIITKSSSKTTGLMFSARSGREEKGSASFRFGDEISPGNFYRVYSRVRKVEEIGTKDVQETKSIGVKADFTPGPDSSFDFSGDFFTGTTEGIAFYPDLKKKKALPFDVHEDLEKARVNSRYIHNFSQDSTFSVQLGYIKERRGSSVVIFDMNQAETEVGLQFSPWREHLVQTGFEYRFSYLEAPGSFDPFLTVLKRENTDQMISGFLSDTIRFPGGRWVLALGSKFEYLEQIGVESSPSVRLSFKIDPSNALWCAASRTIRTPSYLERFLQYHVMVLKADTLGIHSPDWARISIFGNKHLKEEDARSVELGYRLTMPFGFTFDASVFYTRYKDLLDGRIVVSHSNKIAPHFQADGIFDHMVKGSVKGGELSLSWEAASWLTLHGWYAYCKDKYKQQQAAKKTFWGNKYGHLSPAHQFFVRSSLTLPYDVELDLLLRHVSKLAGPDINISAYTGLDARLGIRPTKNIEISLIGKNLLEEKHLEMGNDLAYGAPSMLRRSVLLQLRMDF